MKRTYQRKFGRRKKKHGFRSKMKTKGGRKLLKRRRARGRKNLTVSSTMKKKRKQYHSMKSKILALSKNEEFKNLLKQKKISNKYVTIFYGLLDGKDKYRLNISFVTKKKIGNAVKRNKIKRRLRNIANEAIKKLSLKLKYSYLVIAKPTMLNSEFKIIKETLFQEFSKIKR